MHLGFGIKWDIDSWNLGKRIAALHIHGCGPELQAPVLIQQGCFSICFRCAQRHSLFKLETSFVYFHRFETAWFYKRPRVSAVMLFVFKTNCCEIQSGFIISQTENLTIIMLHDATPHCLRHKKFPHFYYFSVVFWYNCFKLWCWILYRSVWHSEPTRVTCVLSTSLEYYRIIIKM